MRYVIAELTPDEPDFETTPDDCRFTGNAVHALADAYTEAPEQTAATSAPVGAVGASGGVEQTPDAERRLARLRALGGTAKYVRHEWKFTGMADLVESEKANDRKRRSEKTIRADLIQAAQAERDEKSAAFGAGLGQR